MSTPDKIYIGTVPSAVDNATVYTTVSEDFPGAKEYVSTDAILRWVKKQEKNLKYRTVSADAYQLALTMLKEELNRL